MIIPQLSPGRALGPGLAGGERRRKGVKWQMFKVYLNIQRDISIYLQIVEGRPKQSTATNISYYN